MVLIVSRGARSVRPTRARAQLTLTPIDRPEAGVTLNLRDSPKLDPGLPRWTEMDRPRRQSVLRWDGRGVLRQSFNVMFSGAVQPDGQLADVGSQYNALHELAMPSSGGEPPVCYLTGVGYGNWRDYLWQVETLEPGQAWRRRDGLIGQISYAVGLARWLPTDVLVQQNKPPSPAAASDARAEGTATAAPAAATAARTYTVRRGDTLSKIAAAQLKNSKRWSEIASLNGLRDPNRITVGQVLKLP